MHVYSTPEMLSVANWRWQAVMPYIIIWFQINNVKYMNSLMTLSDLQVVLPENLFALNHARHCHKLDVIGVIFDMIQTTY